MDFKNWQQIVFTGGQSTNEVDCPLAYDFGRTVYNEQGLRPRELKGAQGVYLGMDLEPKAQLKLY